MLVNGGPYFITALSFQHTFTKTQAAILPLESMLPRDFPSKVFSRIKVPITETTMMHDEILLCGLFVVYVMTNQSNTRVECYFIPSDILFANKESFMKRSIFKFKFNSQKSPGITCI